MISPDIKLDYIKDPDWANPDNLVATIGHHEFYKP
jgi:hypothetical protein